MVKVQSIVAEENRMSTVQTLHSLYWVTKFLIFKWPSRTYVAEGGARTGLWYGYVDNSSYAYWTVHHLDIWIKVDQLWWNFLYYVNLLLNMFRMLIHPSSEACDYLVRYCVGCIVLTWGWTTTRVVVQAALGYHITNSQSRYITPTRLKSAQYSLHNNAPSSHKLLKMDVLTSETCWAVNWHSKSKCHQSWSTFIQISKIHILFDLNWVLQHVVTLNFFLIFVDCLLLHSFDKLSSVTALSFRSAVLLLDELRPFKLSYLSENFTLRLKLIWKLMEDWNVCQFFQMFKYFL